LARLDVSGRDWTSRHQLRKTSLGVDLPAQRSSWHRQICAALPFGRLWYEQARDGIDYAKFRSCSHDAVIRVYDAAGNVIETRKHKGQFKEGDTAPEHHFIPCPMSDSTVLKLFQC
jgi:hypothetical protein